MSPQWNPRLPPAICSGIIIELKFRPLWSSYVTRRVCVSERDKERKSFPSFDFPPHWLMQNRMDKLLKQYWHFWFVQNMNQVYSVSVQNSTNNSVSVLSTILMGILTVLRVNRWWFVTWMKIWLRSWRSSVSARKPTTQPSSVSFRCYAGTECEYSGYSGAPRTKFYFLSFFGQCFCPGLSRCCGNTISKSDLHNERIRGGKM